MEQEEDWKEIEGTEGQYQVSNLGRVKRRGCGGVVEPSVVLGDYLSVPLALYGKTVRRRVHLLVLAAFGPPQPDDTEPKFKDGNHRHCAADNLEWGPKQKRSGGPEGKTQPNDVVGNFEALESLGLFGKSHVVHWRVRCTRCDREYVVQGQHFREGRCKCDECDYPKFDRPTTEGDIRTKPTKEIREYKKWLDMKNRCKNRSQYAGIQVCEEWQSDFLQFFKDVGPQPGPDYSPDRWPDNDGDYRPNNVRWATPRQQNENRGWSQRPKTDP